VAKDIVARDIVAKDIVAKDIAVKDIVVKDIVAMDIAETVADPAVAVDVEAPVQHLMCLTPVLSPRLGHDVSFAWATTLLDTIQRGCEMWDGID